MHKLFQGLTYLNIFARDVHAIGMNGPGAWHASKTAFRSDSGNMRHLLNV